MKVVSKKINEYQPDSSKTIFSSIFDLPTLKQMTDVLISEAISRSSSVSEAARLLGISRQSLSNRINKI